MVSKVRTFVGFAVKMGKARIGTDKILSAKSTPYVILYDKSLAENGLHKIKNRCPEAEYFCVETELIFPNHHCKVIGIGEKNLAAAIVKELEE